MKTISTFNYTILVLLLAVSSFSIIFYFLLTFFADSFKSKTPASHSPDNFYSGLYEIFNALPLVIILTLIIMALILYFFSAYLAPATLTSILLAVSLFVFQPNLNIRKFLTVSKAQTELNALLKKLDLQFSQLLNSPSESMTQLESPELIKEIEDLIRKSNSYSFRFLKFESFQSVYKFIAQEGLKVSEQKILYVTPVLKKLMLSHEQQGRPDNYPFEIKEWNKTLVKLPYLRLVNFVSFENNGMIAIGLNLKFENTNYPINEFIVTVPKISKDFALPGDYTYLDLDISSEALTNNQSRFYYSKKYEAYGKNKVNEFLDFVTIIFIKDLPDFNMLASRNFLIEN